MNCDEALELMSASLDGELSPPERNALDEHLANCPACAALYEELAGHSRLLRELDCEPPAGLAGRILSQLPDQQPTPVKRSHAVHWRRWGVLAACLALALWTGLTFPNWTASSASPTADSASYVLTNRNAPQSDAQEAPANNSTVLQNEASSYPDEDPAKNAAPEAGFAACSAGPVIGNVQYLRIDWTEDAVSAAQLLTSFEEQTEFLSRYGLDVSAGVPEMDYYEAGALIAVTLEENSGSISHTVETVQPCDGGYEVVIRRQVPEIGTDDMAAWLILIEVDGSITPGDTLTVVLTD